MGKYYREFKVGSRSIIKRSGGSVGFDIMLTPASRKKIRARRKAKGIVIPHVKRGGPVTIIKPMK